MFIDWKENFLNIFNTIGDGSLIIDSKTYQVKYINQKCLDLFGYKLHEVINNNFRIFIPENRRTMHDVFINELSNDRNYNNKVMGKDRVIHARHKNGSDILVKIKLNSLILNKKQHILVQIKNRENKKDIMDKLNTYKDIFHNNIDMICIASIDGYFVEVNDAFVTTLGYSKEELYKQTFLNFVYKQDIDSTILQLKKLSNGSNVVNFKNRYYTKSGKIKWLSWSAIPKSAYLTYAVARDITSDENKINIMIDINNDYRDIEILAMIGSWKWVVGTDRLEWSDGLKKIFNVYNVSFENYMKVIHPDDREKLQEIINECIETKLSYEVYHKIIPQEGVIKYIYGRGKYIVDETGDYMIGIAQDITEKVNANDIIIKYNTIGLKTKE